MAWRRQATVHYLSQCRPNLCRHMASLSHNEFVRSHHVVIYLHNVRPRSVSLLQIPTVNYSWPCMFAIQIVIWMQLDILTGKTLHVFRSDTKTLDVKRSRWPRNLLDIYGSTSSQKINPLRAKFISIYWYNTYFALSVTSRSWDGTGSWNPSV